MPKVARNIEGMDGRGRGRKRETPWPWGWSGPDDKAEELRELIARNEARIRIERDKAEERIRRIGVKIEGYRHQLEFVERCRAEEVRAENRSVAYGLEEKGVRAIEEIGGEEDQDEVRRRLDELETEGGMENADGESRDGVIGEFGIEEAFGIEVIGREGIEG